MHKKGSLLAFMYQRLEKLPMPSGSFAVFRQCIDNAIDALESVNRDKILCIEISEDIKSFNFKISDNGIGIPDSIQKQIFERGFTTKGDSGQGLGLSISKEVIEEHKGSINVTSNAEATVFEFSIPRV